jgi:multidrug transporter EmrE-like cation transporter
MSIRNSDVDTLRALLIVYIVAVIHPMFWLDIAGGVPGTFLLFEMPCIFILSGYSYALSVRNGLIINSISDYLVFCIQRAARIIMPLLIYSLSCVLFLYLTEREKFFGDSGKILDLIQAWINPYSVTRPSTLVLASHLWFIPPFLTVTFLLPLAARIRTDRSIPVWVWLLASVIFLKFLDKANPELRTTIAYLIWALFGYALGAGLKISRHDRLITFLLSLFILYLFALLKPSSLDMQANKFPPNAIFFVFGAGWVAIFLLAQSEHAAKFLKRLDGATLLRPFKGYGYTIYLWQGLGYTLAIRWGREIGAPSVLIMAVAVLLTVAMGAIASPLERMRFRFQHGAARVAECAKTDRHRP